MGNIEETVRVGIVNGISIKQHNICKKKNALIKFVFSWSLTDGFAKVHQGVIGEEENVVAMKIQVVLFPAEKTFIQMLSCRRQRVGDEKTLAVQIGHRMVNVTRNWHTMIP